MGAQARRVEASRGEFNAAWIEAYCRVPEGKLVGQPIQLTPEQRGWLKDIYDTPTRRWVCSMGRKNAKTTFAALLLLLHLVGPEHKPNSQLYSDAQSRDQAAVLFALAAKIVRMSPDLSQYVIVRDTRKELVCKELGTIYRALAAEAATAYGLSPAFVVHDELGQVKGPRSELYEALETGAGAQESPLSVVISTQAPNDGDLLSIIIDDALRGGDPRTKVVLYTASEDLDPFSEEAIRQANPHFDVFMNRQEVLDQAETARRMPSAEAGYRNLVLNQRVSLHSPLIAGTVWRANAGEPDPYVLEEGAMYIGLDLSMRNDLTAAVGVVADDGGQIHVDPHFFTPLNGLRERAHRDRTPYDVWVNEGLIHGMAGASVDYDELARWLYDYVAGHNVKAIAFDRWRIDVFKSALSRVDGGEQVAELLVPFGQGFRDMTPAVDALESALVNRNLRHGGHPVLKMCALNAIATRDPAGNRKLDKSKATGRIDGIVALAMALGVRAAAAPPKPAPVYQMFVVGR